MKQLGPTLALAAVLLGAPLTAQAPPRRRPPQRPKPPPPSPCGNCSPPRPG